MKAWILATALLFLAQPALAQTTRTVQWNADLAIPVRTALGITTQITLDPSEEILDFSIGFAQGWDIVRRDTVFYIKPREPDATTNLLVRSRNRLYLFELAVHKGTWRELSELQRDGVAYRVDVLLPPAPTTPSPRSLPLGSQAEPQLTHCDYQQRRNRWTSVAVLPVWVCDDGASTFLKFSDGQDFTLPVVNGVDPISGVRYAVNHRVKNRTLQVDGIHDRLQLRHGLQQVEISRGQP